MSNVTSVIQNLEPAHSLYKDKMATVTNYLRDRKVPLVLHKRVKAYFEHVRPFT